MRLPSASIALLFASAGLAAAQEAAPAAEAAAVKSPTFAELFAAGGLLMWPLLVLSVFALAYVAYLFCVLREGANAPRALVNDVIDAIRTGRTEGRNSFESALNTDRIIAAMTADWETSLKKEGK